MEKNYSGFADKVGDTGRARYDALSAAIAKQAAGVTKPIYCYGLLREWLGFFRDGHNYLEPRSSLTGSSELVQLSAAEEAALKRRKGVEGIYSAPDSSSTIAVMKNKTGFRDFLGVLTWSRLPNWKRGQIKLELKQTAGARFMAYVYTAKDHSVQVQDFTFDGSSFNGRWRKKGSVDPRRPSVMRSWNYVPTVQARRISDKIFYIGIGSFEGSNATAIDSLFRADSSVLSSTPNLILDLRGNDGGSDYAAAPLFRWLLSKDTLRNVGANVWASEGNIKSWSLLLNAEDMPEESREWVKRTISGMQAHLGQWVGISDDGVGMVPDEYVSPYPQRVVILMNGACASSTEEFLMAAMQSRKVTLMGQHTAGILDYANVREVPLPHLPLTLAYATTRSRRVDEGHGIDNVGIWPAVMLGDGVDWVVEAKKYLESK